VSWRSVTVRVAAIAYAAVLVSLLLMPAPAAIAPGPTEFLETGRLLSGRMGIRDLVINVAVFVPAGFLIHAALRGAVRRRLAVTAGTVVIGAALSVGAEALQFTIPGRYSSASDVAANVAGLALGILLEHLITDAPA
jgi:glycopeptide antibiotics resistance protein